MQLKEPDIKYKILQAAKKLFAAQGFDATTVRQICEEAEANPALVSYHFGGKHNLFVALFDTLYPGGRLPEFDLFEGTVPERLTFFLREVIRFRSNEPELVAILQREIATDSPRMNVIQGHTMPVWRKLRDLLEQGRQEGLFHFRSLNHMLFFVMGTVLFHRNPAYFRPILTEETAGDMEELIQDTLHYVLGGLGYKFS
ncbi:hypothetical protein SY83_00870 [Paenibacillus swuensis]|uniref:HTH tetR-type domain-containing protein n=1 Tax=Paenibacillus swuensis TaxID=1178515 RepID=A0A172TDL0_9BACL|nr:TetR/AcrR family transcriptional regulator [Paenibacillus swuensis]ANE45129.1 hypothetical protein SY83_00870 [Paenibacillus swuensis]